MGELFINKQVIWGAGKHSDISVVIKERGCKTVFVATFSRSALVVAEMLESLDAEKISYFVYDKFEGEPDLHVINIGRDLYLEHGCDCILGIGGGSVLDAAKAIGMLSSNGGLIEEYQMLAKPIHQPSPFFIAVPSTSGTGSEATKVSVIYNNENGQKKSVYHPNMLADVVVLDPELTAGLSAALTATTGMDALSHAIESYVSLNANFFTEMYSLEAMRLIKKSFVTAVKNGDDLVARLDMLIASYFAGCALNAGIGIAHIVAQPLGGMFKIPHGDACSIFLPLSIELNMHHCYSKYRRVAQIFGVDTKNLDDVSCCKQLVDKIKEIRAVVGAPVSLQEYTKEEPKNIKEIIDMIIKTTGHIKCNPRPVDNQLLEDIVIRAF